MRSLREKLMAVASKPSVPANPPKPRPAESFFCRDYHVPIRELQGIECTTLDEIRACDPGFTGQEWDIQKLLFLDTETTGLSGGAGTVAFEIGVGFIEQDHMTIRQYVMRDYSEECAMLQEIAALLSSYPTLITFNGKTFDLPLLESRMILHRIRMHPTQHTHLDLLHVCRRVYKLRLKRCSLSALEEAVLGMTRLDDLPGAQVPQRYFDYIKTREFALLEDVLCHNRQDVQSLAALTGHICSVFRHPEKLSHAEDLFSVGRTYERSGKSQHARRCYKILGHSSMSSQAHMRLAAGYKKERNWEAALSYYQTMIAKAEGGSWPYIECAKYYEHVARDYHRALSYASAALSRELNAALLSTQDDTSIDIIRKRIKRLKAKLMKIPKQ